MEVGDGTEQQKESHSGNGQCKEPQEEQQEDEMEGGNGGDKGQEQVDHPRQPLKGEILETQGEHHPNWRRKLTYIGYNEEYPKTNEHLKLFKEEKKHMAAKMKDLVTKKPQYTRRMMHSGMTHTPQKRQPGAPTTSMGQYIRGFPLTPRKHRGYYEKEPAMVDVEYPTEHD